ncbi:MAG: 3-hydroxyisobutyryl-CoA hydrolase [Corynebacterium sp.]|nr:3-hydroxyisobutyryl-CoA hydrolase [Corynebacterium sp.]
MTGQKENRNTSPATDAPVIVTVSQRTGILELNRPKALNSLSMDMVDIISSALDTWRDDADIDQVLIVSNHPKAFCAGGDVRGVRGNLLAGNVEEVNHFFREEYRMNGDMAEYPKPLIALIDGVVMGGGLGISIHGSHRIVTDKAFASMPEMAIGFVTDVAVAHKAQRVVGTRGVASPALARYWSITGYRMYAADMMYSGVATHYVKDIDAVREDIIALGVDAALEKHATMPADEPPLAAMMPSIESTFDKKTWPEVEAALEAGDADFARQTRELMTHACPTSIVAAMELLNRHEDHDDVRTALADEESLGRYIRSRSDFAEGVRAVLVDKTRDASFNPPTTADVEIEPIRSAFTN